MSDHKTSSTVTVELKFQVAVMLKETTYEDILDLCSLIQSTHLSQTVLGSGAIVIFIYQPQCRQTSQEVR